MRMCAFSASRRMKQWMRRWSRIEALKERVEFMKQGASYMQEESEPAASKSLKCFIEIRLAGKIKVFKVWKAEKRICRSMEKMADSI